MPDNRLPEPFPRYWMDETSGVLRSVIEGYLAGADMSGDQIAAMRAYLRQWINSSVWKGDGVSKLRTGIDGIKDRCSLEKWLNDADSIGIDPL